MVQVFLLQRPDIQLISDIPCTEERNFIQDLYFLNQSDSKYVQCHLPFPKKHHLMLFVVWSKIIQSLSQYQSLKTKHPRGITNSSRKLPQAHRSPHLCRERDIPPLPPPQQLLHKEQQASWKHRTPTPVIIKIEYRVYKHVL